MRPLINEKTGNVDIIVTAIIAAVLFAISIPIIFTVLGNINTTTTDASLAGSFGYNATRYKPSTNASRYLLGNINVFYSVGSLYIVIMAAIGIIAGILMLRGG